VLEQKAVALTSLDQQRPVDLLMMLVNTTGSTPSLLPNIKASLRLLMTRLNSEFETYLKPSMVIPSSRL
jgi:hypothetical protein